MSVKPKRGSICLTDLADAFRNGHSAFTTAKNGKVYANIVLWENEPDQYGNTGSFQLNSAKDSEDKKVYFGNLKSAKSEPKQDMPF